jgi:hypothetical protein
MCALYGRAESRDFIDIDAILRSGQYTRTELLALAGDADAGFDSARFADALGALDQITDADFDEYGVTADDLATMRASFARWRTEIMTVA